MSENYFVHESSYIDDGVEVGKGTKIWYFCHLMSGAKVGKDCNFGQNVVVHPTAIIGNGVKIQNNVSVYDGVILEDHVFCGPSCVFTNISNPRSEVNRNSPNFFLKTHVKHGATIGANATIVCGTTIGRYAFIGAGAVVTRDIPDYALVYGNPSRLKGWRCECGESLTVISHQSQCTSCQKKYVEEKEVLKRVE